MKGTIITAWIFTLFTLTLSEGLGDYGPHGGKQDFGRIFRPSQDLKMTETRNVKHNTAGSRKQNGQVVYGKPVFLDQPQRQRTSQKKFRPSPEDPFAGSEYLQPHYHKYAQQLYTAQKNAGYLSEYQKYIINQDPDVKKFVLGQKAKPKQVDPLSGATQVFVSTTSAPIVSTTTEKLREIKVLKEKAKTKVNVKNEKEEDSSAQSTAYKFVIQPEYVPVPVYTQDDSLLHQHASVLPTAAYYTPSYAPSAHLTLDSSFKYKIPETYSEKEEHPTYPTKEPSYQFRYDVKDGVKHSHFGHAEARKGKTTWGKYYVQLSDGRFETVKYWADKTGYHAEVDFKGEAKHPPPVKEHNNNNQAFSLDDLKLYSQDNAAHQLSYSVSENPAIEFH